MARKQQTPMQRRAALAVSAGLKHREAAACLRISPRAVTQRLYRRRKIVGREPRGDGRRFKIAQLSTVGQL